jgi:hypothetical protein
MTDLNMDLKDLTQGQKIAMGVGILLMVGYVGQQLDPVTPPPNTAPVIRYETAPRAPQPKDDAKAAAELLTGSQRQADQIRRISSKHKTPPNAIADKAAKTAEICQQQDHVGDLRGWAFGSLTFVDEITEPITLDDAFVTYVLMGCPT